MGLAELAPLRMMGSLTCLAGMNKESFCVSMIPFVASLLLALVGHSATTSDPRPWSLRDAGLQDPPSTEVFVRGRGATVDEARKDAQRAALDVAVGGLVDVETRVVKDEVIETVLKASAGYIEKLTIVSEPVLQEGVWEVRARVVVRKNMLKEALVKEKVVGTAMEGGSLFAEVTSKKANAASASDILARNLASYPLSVLSAEIVGKPTILSQDREPWVVGVDVKVRLDAEAWDKQAEGLRAVLKSQASDQFSFSLPKGQDVQFSPSKYPFMQVLGPVALESDRITPGDGFLSGGYHKSVAAKLAFDAESFWILVPDFGADNVKYSAYRVPNRLMAELARLCVRRVWIEVDAFDKDGKFLQTAGIFGIYALPVPLNLSRDSYSPFHPAYHESLGLAAHPRSGGLHASGGPLTARSSVDVRDLFSFGIKGGHTWRMIFPNLLVFGGTNQDIMGARLGCREAVLRLALEVGSDVLQRTEELRCKLQMEDVDFKFVWKENWSSEGTTETPLKASDLVQKAEGK